MRQRQVLQGNAAFLKPTAKASECLDAYSNRGPRIAEMEKLIGELLNVET